MFVFINTYITWLKEFSQYHGSSVKIEFKKNNGLTCIVKNSQENVPRILINKEKERKSVTKQPNRCRWFSKVYKKENSLPKSNFIIYRHSQVNIVHDSSHLILTEWLCLYVVVNVLAWIVKFKKVVVKKKDRKEYSKIKRKITTIQKPKASSTFIYEANSTESLIALINQQMSWKWATGPSIVKRHENRLMLTSVNRNEP